MAQGLRTKTGHVALAPFANFRKFAAARRPPARSCARGPGGSESARGAERASRPRARRGRGARARRVRASLRARRRERARGPGALGVSTGDRRHRLACPEPTVAASVSCSASLPDVATAGAQRRPLGAQRARSVESPDQARDGRQDPQTGLDGQRPAHRRRSGLGSRLRWLRPNGGGDRQRRRLRAPIPRG